MKRRRLCAVVGICIRTLHTLPGISNTSLLGRDLVPLVHWFNLHRPCHSMDVVKCRHTVLGRYPCKTAHTEKKPMSILAQHRNTYYPPTENHKT